MKHLIIGSLIFIIFWGCSSSKEITVDQNEQKDKEEVYVFEDVNQKPIIDNTILEEPENKVIVDNQKHSTLFYVQVGAYTTKSAAEKFLKEAKSKLEYELNIIFDSSKNLFVIQIEPAFQNKIDAENVRNSLWKIQIFKDAWIREEIN
ncbi:MAG TPA: SPOR domain-containing protein [Melioribacteraceae bacterium]|nr:SPOR domain-containing protein [Melioribacteraceae bacterium]